MKRFAALACAAAALALSSSCASAPPKKAPPAAAEAAAPATPAAVDAPPAAVAAFLAPYGAATQPCRAALVKAETLSSQGKWKSAYQAMEDFDKDNADPFALAMKTSIVLRGAVRSDQNLAFALVDLEEGQDLEALREAEGDYVPFELDPPALAAAQASKGVASPGILSKELGDYYYDVIGRFSGRWALSDEEILAKALENYAKAYLSGIYDGSSLTNHAEALVRLNRGDESDPIYRKALELDPKGASILYSYATSLAYRGKKAEALSQVDRAIEAYGQDGSRISAIALGARIAAQLGDAARLQGYYSLADAGYPDTPTAGILRHVVSVESGDSAAAAAAADSLVAEYGANPSIVRTLVSTWYEAGDIEAPRAFMERNIAKGGDETNLATLYFYYAIILAQGEPAEGDKALALKALDEAESRFKASIGPESDVYGAITELRAVLLAPAAGDAGN
jgi:tetratricopeptide (TPR) repeat protein